MYMQAADVLKKIEAGESLKKAVFGMQIGKQSGPAFKMNLRIAEHKELLEDMLQLVAKAKHVRNREMAIILIYELFLGCGKIRGGGALKKAIVEMKDQVLAKFGHQIEKIRESYEQDTEHNDELVQLRPYYLDGKQALEEIRDSLKNQEIDPEEAQLDTIILDVINIKYRFYRVLLKEGLLSTFAIQGWSSCLPPYLAHKYLDIQEGDEILDACSAPGNKTLQYLKYFPQCKVFAIEKDKKRHSLLHRRILKYAENASSPYFEVMNADFLDLSPIDPKFANISLIALDPSCSGSGIRGRTTDLDETRITNLADFQQKMILHASKFPKIKYIVYSTCSTHQSENEENVARAISSISKTIKIELVPLLQGEWTNRGQPAKTQCTGIEGCIRVEKGKTDGFFVAIFKLEKQL